MVAEVVDYIRPRKDGIYVDCTLGGGGHALEILKRCGGCSIVAFDVDPVALKIAEGNLRMFERRVRIFRRSYTALEETLDELGIEEVDGIIADLGVSSFQLDSESRGFSFRYDAPLDMRMDPTSHLTAWNVVNEYPLEKLDRIIRDYGEERFHRSIARSIVASRPVNTTSELVKAIEKGIPSRYRRSRKRHFATRVFQAIRIEVNRELENLKELLRSSERVLKSGGRIAVISFHSLEDRLVKRFFRESNLLRPITKSPVLPSEEEVMRNPRARSAKLRVAERI